MNTRTEAVARLLSEKLELDLPPALLALALSQVSQKPAAALEPTSSEPVPAPDAAVADTRPLASVIGLRQPVSPAAGKSSRDLLQGLEGDLAEQLPQLLRQLGFRDGSDRRAELSALASRLGTLLGGSKKTS